MEWNYGEYKIDIQIIDKVGNIFEDSYLLEYSDNIPEIISLYPEESSIINDIKPQIEIVISNIDLSKLKSSLNRNTKFSFSRKNSKNINKEIEKDVSVLLKIDGIELNCISIAADTIKADVNFNLANGLHFVDFLLNYNDYVSQYSWVFTLDATPPEISDKNISEDNQFFIVNTKDGESGIDTNKSKIYFNNMSLNAISYEDSLLSGKLPAAEYFESENIVKTIITDMGGNSAVDFDTLRVDLNDIALSKASPRVYEEILSKSFRFSAHSNLEGLKDYYGFLNGEKINLYYDENSKEIYSDSFYNMEPNFLYILYFP